MVWSQLDKRPQQSELISYDPDEIAEVGRLTAKELKRISRPAGGGPALNKETSAFLDATSIVRALSRVAEDRFERGSLDAAARTVINAIRWQRSADGLYMAGGVTLPRPNPTRLWYLLAEIYVRMDERDLALKTVQKAGAGVSEIADPSLTGMLPSAAEEDAPPAAATTEVPDELATPAAAITGLLRSYFDRLELVRHKRSLLIIGAVILGLLAFTAFRAQVVAKSMIDSNSQGVDYLNIAFGPNGQNRQDEALLLAAQEFATLRAQLDSWAWITTASSILPPAHDQFVGMTRMADLGMRLVAAPYALDGAGRLTDVGSPLNVCKSAERLRSFDGGLLGQLKKNRTEMLSTVSVATQGACDPG